MRSPRCQSIAAPAGFVPFTLPETEQSIPARFDRIAWRWPARLAVKQGAAEWTYARLQAAADSTAAAVRERLGDRPRPVALLLRQTPELLASILGVMKAGHFYVPLDPDHPGPALAAVMGDSEAALIITDRAGRSAAAELSPVDAIDVSEAIRVPPAPAGRPFPSVQPEALACVYYTSGSTGRPKGVMDTHRNVLHNVLRYTNGLKICASDRLSLVQSPTFSGVMSSQFGGLLNGAAVLPFDIGTDGLTRIGPWLRDERITVYHSVPVIFRHVAGALGDRHVFPDVRIVRLEGDGATLGDVDLFRRHFTAGAVLAHALGATECGLALRFVIGRDTPLDAGVVPIGYPVEDITVRVLDDLGRDVAEGEIGEIAIESRYLSPGYWGRPDLTAAAFTDGRTPGSRLYRTGDVGRLGADGCLAHLGRTDGQPKVRGLRVDVEAIEAALHRTGLAKEALVVVRSSPVSEARLIAYVVPRHGRRLEATALRRELSRLVPAASLPSRFVVLDRLPVTAAHKIDREALPAVDSARPLLDVPCTAPRTRLESTIAGVWATTLAVDPIGVHDSFFDLGGDSLTAADMLSRVSGMVGGSCTMPSIVECPTVAKLAAAIEAMSDGATDVPSRRVRSPLVRVQPTGSRRPFFFLHAEYGGDGSYCLNLARHLGFDQPFFALSPLGRDGEAVPCSIEAIAERYVSAIREQQPAGPYSLGGFCSSAVVAWEMARQFGRAGERVALLVLINPPAIECGRVAHAIHAVARLGGQLGASKKTQQRAVSVGKRLAAFRFGRTWTTTLRRLAAGRRESATADRLQPDARAAISEAYRRAVDGYLAAPFDGPVVCLQSTDESDQARREWDRLASRFSARRITGDHNSCIITHSKMLALTLAPRLAAATGDS